jgi:hypothetical protein
MMDIYPDYDGGESVIKRDRELKYLGQAISRTERLLRGPGAQNPRLRQIWTTRLQRQQRHLQGAARNF